MGLGGLSMALVTIGLELRVGDVGVIILKGLLLLWGSCSNVARRGRARTGTA